jgi:hypothetical protein
MSARGDRAAFPVLMEGRPSEWSRNPGPAVARVGPGARSVPEAVDVSINTPNQGSPSHRLGGERAKKMWQRREATMPDPDPRTPGERLATIAGRWRSSGDVIGEPRVSVIGTDIYEVVPGGHFLVHYVDVAVGGQPVRAIEVIGESDGRGGYLARSFDSEGNAELMHLTVDDDGVFRFTGGGDIAPTAQPKETPTARVRPTLTIARDRESMSALRERSDDGITWHPWMDIHFTPADDTPGPELA